MILTQEKAKQNGELRLVHESKEDLAAELQAQKDQLRDKVEAEKQARAALEEEKAGLTTEIQERVRSILGMRSWRLSTRE